MPGHSDGLNQISASFEEYFAGELLYRMGISDASRVLAIIALDENRTLSDGKTQAQASILVRVQPTNIRFAHLWSHKDNPSALRSLLQYHFSRSSEFRGLSFDESAKLLLLQNVHNSAKEMAVLDNFQIAQMSPTRGNRLINGQLIDWATLNIFDLNYREFHEHRDLGTGAQQEDYSVHWLTKTKEVLATVAPGVATVEIESLFRKRMALWKIKMLFVRIGMTATQSEFLIETNKKSSDELFEILQGLKNLMTAEPVVVGRKRMKMPVLDFRKMLGQLPWDQIASGKKTFLDNPEEAITKFGAKISANASYDALSFRRHLAKLTPLLKNIIISLSEKEKSDPISFGRKLRSIASTRNSKKRTPGFDSRITRLKHLEQLFMQTPDISKLQKSLNSEINGLIDFNVGQGVNVIDDDGATAVQEVIQSAGWRDSPAESNAVVPRWLQILTLKYPAMKTAIGDLQNGVSTIAAENVIKVAKMGVWNSPLSGAIKMLLDRAFEVADPAAKLMITGNVIAAYANHFQFKNIQNQFHEYETFRTVPIMRKRKRSCVPLARSR